MKVLIAGATGLIGNELVRQCHERQIDVHYLSTRKEALKNDPNYKGFYWNLSTGELDTAAFDGVDAIINLAGATVSKRWTSSYKNLILDSRVKGAELIQQKLNETQHTVTHYISASGISIYPSSFSKNYSEEDTDKGSSFLYDVTLAWEEAADAITTLGIKVAKLRTGIVLSSAGGAFPKMRKPIAMGVGSPLGSGKQWQSWIHIHDMAAMYLHIMLHGKEGTFNAVAPNPVTNAELTKAIATKLGKSTWFPNVPGFMLKLLLGEMGSLALESQKVDASKIREAGFDFKYPTVEAALTELVA